MAKGAFWLRGARGKLAGSVLQKGENGTVIRENVTPRNPQTNDQMVQRVAFATTANAAKIMQPIIGHSFEGVNSEKENRRRFLQMNVNRLRNGYLNAPGGGTVSVDFLAKPKMVSQLIPNPYIISQGSLSIPSRLRIHSGEDGLVTGDSNSNPDGMLVSHFDVGKTYTHADFISELYGLKPGQQWTIATIAVNSNTQGNIAFDGSAIYPNTDTEGQNFVRYSMFEAARIVFLDDESLPANTFTFTADTTTDQVEAFRKECIDVSKSDAKFINDTSVTVYLPSDGALTVNVTSDPYYFSSPFGWIPVASQAIISELKNNIWQYSTSILACDLSENSGWKNAYTWGMPYYTAKETYLKTFASVNSDMFLDQGGTQNVV